LAHFMSRFALILPAAGRSVRYGAGTSKLLENLAGIPVIARAIHPFLQRSDLAKIIIPCNEPDELAASLRNPSLDPRIEFCAGGASRADSVCKALLRAPQDIEWIAVHDAARPLISPQLIESTLNAAQKHGAAVPALPAALTIKQATGPLPAKVERTLPRQSLWTMQTPQIMRRSDLLRAYESCRLPLDQVTDDVQLLEMAGNEVWLVPGEERNLKITTPMDMRLAELWLGM
jgi:2-C-methyl-D-erythritol 4-phosphate cytidylyltransferase